MSEPMQPSHDGGMTPPPQTTPASDPGTTGGDATTTDRDDRKGGMIGEGDVKDPEGSDV
jgi:hypothetical protein